MHEKNKFSDLFFSLNTKKIVVFIFFIGFIVFFNMLFNGFVEDDKSYIINYDQIHTVNILNSFTGNLFNFQGQYRPIPYLYYSVLYNLFTTNPFFYHFLQLLIHIFCVVLIFFIFKKFFSITISFFLATVFLVHPMNVESVSYIAQSTHPIFLFFGLMALILAINKNNLIKNYGLIFCFLLLAVLSKETGVVFIALIPLYKLLYKDKKSFAKFFTISSLSFCIYMLIRFFIGNVWFADRLIIPIVNISFMDRLSNIPSVILFYFKTFFYPINLSIDQIWIIPKLNLSMFYLPLFLLITFTLVIIFVLNYLFRKNQKHLFKSLLFFTCWLIFGLIIHSQIVPLDKTVSEGWFYLPMIGLLGIIGVFIEISKDKFKKISIYIAITILIALSIRTINRNSNWHDSITLYTHDIKNNKDNYIIENNIGVEYDNLKNYPLAIEHLKKSVELRPHEQNLTNLALSHIRNGDLKLAKEYFILAFNSIDYEMYTPHKHDISLYKNYSMLMVFYEKDPSSIPLIKEGVNDYQNIADLWMFLAIAYYQNNDLENAKKSILRSYVLDSRPFIKNIYDQIFSNTNKLVFTFIGFDNSSIIISIPQSFHPIYQ